MTLKDYLIAHFLTVRQFAYISRLSTPVIYRVLNNTNISPKSAKRIFTLTHGKVDYKNLQSFNVSKT